MAFIPRLDCPFPFVVTSNNASSVRKYHIRLLERDSIIIRPQATYGRGRKVLNGTQLTTGVIVSSRLQDHLVTKWYEQGYYYGSGTEGVISHILHNCNILQRHVLRRCTAMILCKNIKGHTAHTIVS